MKKVFIMFAAFALASCGNNNNDNHSENNSKEINPKIESCTYKYNKDNETKLFWTAFKTSAKIGVGGSFEHFIIQSDSTYQNLTDLLSESTFNIDVSSTNTNNEERDVKILKSFFGTMLNTKSITGKIESVNGDEKEGKCQVELKMNDQSQTVGLNYSMNNDTLSIKGEININDFKAEEALTALNKVCSDLHKGEDGKSITWPNINIGITTVLDKSCK